MPALGLEFERTLKARPAEVRRALVDALRRAGFEVTAEQLTRIEAKRGSRLLGGTMMPSRMLPIVASFEIGSTADGCLVAGRLADRGFTLGGKAWGSNRVYRTLFEDVVAGVDRELALLDPAAAESFPRGRFWSEGGEIAALEVLGARGSRAGTAILGKAAEVLEGGPREHAPAAWKGVETVRFGAARGAAVLSLDQTQAHLGVALMVAAQEGSLPPRLRAEVEAFSVRVEALLAGATGRVLVVDVAAAEEPVFEFLHQQVRIRDGLPVRTLHTCRTCHFQKVTSEDFARIQARNQRLRSLVGGVGATLSGGTIQPFILLGQLFRLKRLDPDYVCPRCQGLEAEERVVTFCPECGELRPEAVLRVCGKCGHDFRAALGREDLWAAAEPATPATGRAAEQADAPAAGRRVAEPADASAAGRAAEPAPTACASCGTHLAGGFAFCPGCGRPVDRAGPAPA